MAFIGSTPEFNILKDDWTLYSEILEQFFEINSIEENKKKCAYLISVIGQDCYKILKEKCYPEIPKNKSYDELCELLSKHFGKKSSVFLIRRKFFRASQYPRESITMWFHRVKLLSKECHFGGHIESILVDRFITGLTHAPLDDFFKETDEISLDKAFNMALRRERNGEGSFQRDERSENKAGEKCSQDVNNSGKNRNRRNNNKKTDEKLGKDFEIIDGKEVTVKKEKSLSGKVSANNLGADCQKKDKNVNLERNDFKRSDSSKDCKVDNFVKITHNDESNVNINETSKHNWKAELASGKLIDTTHIKGFTDIPIDNDIKEQKPQNVEPPTITNKFQKIQSAPSPLDKYRNVTVAQEVYPNQNAPYAAVQQDIKSMKERWETEKRNSAPVLPKLQSEKPTASRNVPSAPPLPTATNSYAHVQFRQMPSYSGIIPEIPQFTRKTKKTEGCILN